MRFAGFQWDRGNREKCRKHGVPQEDIETIFERPVSVFPDIAHSGEEERFIAIGKTGEGRYILLVFTLRSLDGETFIRPISARYMHKKEVEYYEKEAADAGQRR